MSVVLRPITAAAAADVTAGRSPGEVRVADGYPTEFSTGMAQAVGQGQALGPFYVHRGADDVVVGEIGGALVEGTTAEIGYAIVEPAWGHGHASAAVLELVGVAAATPGIDRLRGHTPLDRPASGRVLEKAGFTPVGEVEDEHEGAVLRVIRWELDLAARPRTATPAA